MALVYTNYWSRPPRARRPAARAREAPTSPRCLLVRHVQAAGMHRDALRGTVRGVGGMRVGRRGRSPGATARAGRRVTRAGLEVRAEHHADLAVGARLLDLPAGDLQ